MEERGAVLDPRAETLTLPSPGIPGEGKSSQNFQDFEFHCSAGSFDADGFADAGFHEGFAHGAVDGDGEDVTVGRGGLGLANEFDDGFAVIVEVEQLDGVAEEDHVVGDAFVGNDGYVAELGFQFCQLPLNGAVFFLGEMIFGVLGEVTQCGGLANALLDVDLHLVKLFALGLQSR